MEMTFSISSSANIILSMPRDHKLILPDTFYVPKLAANLILVGQLVENKCSITSPSDYVVKDWEYGNNDFSR